MTDENTVPEPQILIEASDDDNDITLGQFREKTKDLPDDTPLITSVITPREYLEDPEDDGSEGESAPTEESVESADEEEDDEEVITAPIVGVSLESYTDDSVGADGKPGIRKAVAIIIHLDDVLGPDEDDEEEDEPTEPSA